MPRLAIADPLAHVFGRMIERWTGAGLPMDIYEGGAMVLTHRDEHLQHLYFNAGISIGVVRERYPDERAWYVVLVCKGLPNEMSISVPTLRSAIPPEVKAGAVAIVSDSDMGAVLASWLRGAVRPEVRAARFSDVETATAWLAEHMASDRRGSQ